MSDMEEWRDIIGYEGLYQVSSLGRVRSFHKTRYPGFDKENGYRILKQGHSTHGRTNDCFVVVLVKDKNKKTTNVHRLVAESFISNPNNKPCINHKDGNPLNNNVNNLEWCTYLENTQDAIKRGTLHIGDMCVTAKLTREQVMEIRNNYTGEYGYCAKIARALGVSPGVVNGVVLNKTYKNI